MLQFRVCSLEKPKKDWKSAAGLGGQMADSKRFDFFITIIFHCHMDFKLTLKNLPKAEALKNQNNRRIRQSLA